MSASFQPVLDFKWGGMGAKKQKCINTNDIGIKFIIFQRTDGVKRTYVCRGSDVIGPTAGRQLALRQFLILFVKSTSLASALTHTPSLVAASRDDEQSSTTILSDSSTHKHCGRHLFLQRIYMYFLSPFRSYHLPPRDGPLITLLVHFPVSSCFPFSSTKGYSTRSCNARVMPFCWRV